MKLYNSKSFTQKLIYSLLTVLFIIYVLLFLSIYIFSRKSIHANANNQANIISSNAIRTIARHIDEIEQIPHTVFGFIGHLDTKEALNLPQKVLDNYPYLTECFIEYDTTTFRFLPATYVHVARIKSNLIRRVERKSVPFIDSTRIFRKNNRMGCWSFRHHTPDSIRICYCETIYSEDSRRFGTFGIEFSPQCIIDFIPDIKVFDSGYMFLVDREGNLITRSLYSHIHSDNLYSYARQQNITDKPVIDKIIQGEKGSEVLFLQGMEYYVFYMPVEYLDWRLIIVCPYHEILFPSSKFYWILLFVALSSMFFLIWAIFKIVHKISEPLVSFTGNVRKILDGELDTNLPLISSHDEIKELHDAFKYMQENIHIYMERLKSSTAEREKMNTEMKLARKLQSRFLPKPIQLPSHLELYGELKQSKSVGGDLYEYFIMDHYLYFAIGDVAGKGVPAALYMASIVKLFRYVASRQRSTAAICNTINTYMCDQSDDDMYVTMFIGIMDINTGQILFTNAGHPEPLVIYENHCISSLNQYQDIPIGILEDYKFEEHTYELRKNNQIFLYTDGVTDVVNKKNQFFSKKQLFECLKKTTDLHPRTTINQIVEQMQLHIENTDQSDDYTILSILYKGEVSDKTN